ncbi:hypothetical protein SCOCK_160100 [Actinacidiphila cocklensis]|uniref:Uncharacterized protein n=1 Tax=Actinacidiphila cocklensis TaxID=887465 RepID=A0A9W4DQR8_9ACTN|nr:hypothetical protein SCOCK_160100 [Actinacidiphila cocklensis]
MTHPHPTGPVRRSYARGPRTRPRRVLWSPYASEHPSEQAGNPNGPPGASVGNTPAMYSGITTVCLPADRRERARGGFP